MELFIAWGIRLISAALILIAGRVIGNWLNTRIQTIKKLDSTLKSFLGGFAKNLIMAIAIITVLGQFGVQTASLLAILGAAGLAIGLALQGTLSNVSAGVMLLILRPFNVGDFITAGGISGTVKSIGLFATELSTGDNVYIFAPNSGLWNADIHNFSRNKTRRIDLVFGISYSDDINKAFKTIEKTLKGEKRLLTAKDKKPVIMVSNLGESSVDITARIWCSASDYWGVKWDLTKATKEALDKDGLTIPFPTTTIEYASTAPAVKAVPSKKKKAA